MALSMMENEKQVFQSHAFSDFSDIYEQEGSLSPLSSDLTTEFIGKSIHYFRQTDSTSIKAYELAQSGAPEGTVVIAESQSSGKGRRGRVWHSPEGENIYTSIILRPPVDPGDAPKLTLVAAVALTEAITSFVKGTLIEGARIKWPNDILIGSKKCAGILTEMKCSGKQVDFVVIGVGVNVNMNIIPPEILAMATSIALETGKVVSRVSLLLSLYSNMENWYKRYLLEGFLPVRERWNELSGMRGKQVSAASGTDEYVEGRAVGINDDGALLLEKQDGNLINVTVGDINIL